MVPCQGVSLGPPTLRHKQIAKHLIGVSLETVHLLYMAKVDLRLFNVRKKI
jgi:hypothetical protein